LKIEDDTWRATQSRKSCKLGYSVSRCCIEDK
jgi:hypothetical protein